MNILELDSFNLADAVKFNDKLNPRLWSGNKMRPEVREKLLAIAADFKESLGLSDLDVKDITVSGSNAGFTYTPHSDIDLHLVVQMPDHCDEVYQELFNAKKYEYNNEHDVKIGGYDVELYVQPADQEHVSAGVYSVKNDDWIHIPRKVPATTDDAVVKDKYELVKSAIESALKSKDINRMRKVWDKVKEMRKAGLAKNGELGPENLAFKMLRTQGDLGELKDTIRRAKDAELSLAEQNKEKKPFVYGFKSVEEDATLTPDGVNPTTCMFLNEQDPVSDEDILRDFITFVARELKLKELPIIKLRRDPQWPVVHTTFGRYMDDKNMLEVAWGQRHIMDVLRTVAHELTHRRQHEREDVPMDAGETGSPYENEANARAGILMRDYARLHPEYFEKGQAQGLHGDEVSESASGYIPKNKKEARDPRYAMALTVDIKPGQTGKEANKLALDTDRQGRPGLLMKTVNLRESKISVKPSPGKGNGLFATKLIKAGEVITRSEFVPINDQEWDLIKNTTPVKLYGFKLGNQHALQPGPFKFQFKDPKEKALWNKTKFKDLSLSGFMFVNGADSPNEVNSEEKFSGNTAEMIATRDIQPGEEIIKQYNVPTTGLAEGKMAELDMDLEDPEITDRQFEKMYGMTRKEARELFSQTDMWAFPELRDPNQPLHEQGVAEGSLNEYRDRLLQYVKSLLPTWPEYVLKDWLVPNKGDFSNLPDTELKNGIMEKLKLAGLTPNTKWQLVPNMKFTMDMFEPMTTKRLIGRAGGHSDMGLNVPRDKERHATQAALAQQQGGVRKEPVLLIKTSKGYELLEGWHRTIQHFAKYPQGYTGPAYVAVAQGQQGVAEGQLDEISQDTARSYAQKATQSKKDLINQTYRKGADTDKLNKKIQNRQQGLNRAHTDKRYYKDELGVAEDKPKSYGYGSTPLTQEPGGIEDALGNQEATGPEFPPQMPAGTTKIDVSDLTDWYRLGMDISDMDDADPKDYNQGPPQTVIVFPSDEAEQGYLKQFKRLGLKTHDIDPDVKGGEDIYGKHLRNKLSQELREFKEQDLFEIKMSPSSLKAEAAKTGAMAGMEFEMIVPGTNVEIEPDYEMDMDQDQRSRSFSDIRDFFFDGDYNGRRDVDSLINEMSNQFIEWQDEQLFEGWEEEGFELLKEYIENNGYFDDAEASEEATNAIQAEYGDDISPEDFQKMLDAIVKEKFDEFVQFQWDEQGQYYDEAREEYMDEQRAENDESDWLQENYPYMSDISQNFDIQWPYYYDANQGDNEMDIERVADSFSDAVDMRTNWSSSYHGARREPDAYVVEPDGSLEPDDSDDGGLEFVSPPMPIDKMVDQLNKVKAWADDNGCYTNRSTGLHINISVPNYDLAKLDYVKLALLLGDKYVLDQYGRSSNTYAKSALGKVQDLIRRDPSKGKDLLDKMRGHMEDLATKAIHSGSTDKYTSINTKSGYIEFRSPGGDWLNANFDKIENTLMRFTVALSAAMDPAAYREEYLKKLYKLLEPVAEEAKGLAGKGAKDTVKYFADYVAGKTPQAALRSFVKQAQLERRIKRGQTPADGKTDYWWDVWRDGDVPNGPGVQVVAKTREEALTKAAKEFGLASPEYMPSATATPIRPFDTSPVKAQVGEPQAVGQQRGGLYKIYDTRGGLIAGDEYGSDQEALERAKYWALRRTLDVVVKNAQGQEVGRVSNSGEITPAGQQSASQGNWGIWIINADRFANQPGEYPRGATPPMYRFPSREAAEQWIEQQRAARPNMRTDIEVREIEPTRSAGAPREYEIFADTDPFTVVRSFYAADDQAAQAILDQYRQDHPGTYYRAHRAPVPGSTLALQRQRAAAAQHPGGIINTANEPTTGSQVGQTYNPSGSGEFTGQWLILNPNNRVIYRFGGIGNSQSDANRHAMNWLTQNPREMVDGVTVVPEIG